MKFIKPAATFALSLMSLASAGILLFLTYTFYNDGPGINPGLIAAAILALIFTLITNPLTSGLFGFKGRVVRTLTTQVVLVVLGIGALFGAYQLYQRALTERNDAADARMAVDALPKAMETCKRIAINGGLSRDMMDCEGWFIRARSLREYHDPKDYALLLIWHAKAQDVADGGAPDEDDWMIEQIMACEAGDAQNCMYVGTAYWQNDPGHPAAALVSYACEQGIEGRGCEVLKLSASGD